jgi:hypothetical protein
MRQFPPPGFPVVRDTAVLDGMAAARRGHGFRALAIGLGLATLVLWVLLWRLARTLAPGVL